MRTIWKKHGRLEIALTPTLPGVWRAKAGGWYVRGRAIDPKTGRLKEVGRLLNLPEASAALTWLERELQRIRAGEVTQPKTSRQRFAAFAASLLERKTAVEKIWSAKGRQKWQGILEHHLIPAFGAMWVDAITRADVEVWREELAGKVARGELAPATANTRLAVLRVILGAVRPGGANPAAVERFDEESPYTEEWPNALAPHDVPRFLAEMRHAYPQHFAMTALGFATGLRPSSMRPLRRCGPSSDLRDDGTLLVRRSVTLGEAADRTKTGRKQKIHLPDDMMEILRWHIGRMVGPQAASDLLFPSDTGGFRADSVLDKPFKRVARQGAARQGRARLGVAGQGAAWVAQAARGNSGGRWCRCRENETSLRV